MFPCLTKPLRRRAGSAVAFALAVLAFAGAAPAPSPAQTLEESSAATPAAMKQAVRDQRADYRLQQFQRLAHNSDRDSLIGATLLGMPTDNQHSALPGQGDVAQRLQAAHGKDPTALFALALSCQTQSEPCDAKAYDALLQLEPDNAVHWLLLPNGATPSDAQLHSAAAATYADSHLRDLVRILRAALSGQTATASAGLNAQELALQLRRDAVDQVALPKLGAVVAMCKAAVDQRRTDCIELGRRLTNDRSGTFLARMVGSAMLRRLVKGTPEEAAAKEMRREYTWLSEQLTAKTVSYERLQDEIAQHGEREACQRAVERMGVARTPPQGWLPKDPQTLLLSEERAAAPAK